jgi:PAS domain S-box-containing protein
MDAEAALQLPKPHSRGVRWATFAASCLAVAVLGGSAWLAYDNLEGVEASDTLGDRVHAARFASEALLSTLKDAETGQRGYLLTGDILYLGPYEVARGRLDGDLAVLVHAPLASPQRAQRIHRIDTLTEAKLSELGRTIAFLQAGKKDAALDVVRSNQGKQIMDTIRAEVDGLNASADLALEQARERVKSLQAWYAVFGLAGLGGLLLSGVVLAHRRAHRSIVAGYAKLVEFARAFGLTQGILRDTDGRITFWNKGAERLYGYTSDEAIGRISHELLRVDFPQPREAIEAEFLRNGQWQGELVHSRRDGSRLNIVSHWAMHRGALGGADSVIEVNADVTALNQAQAALRESEQKLRLVLGASDTGTWAWDLAKGTELEWDARCKMLFGFPSDSPVDYQAWANAILPEDRKQAEEGVARAIDPATAEDDFVCDYRVVHPDGAVRWLAAAGRALFDQDRSDPVGCQAVRIQGTIRDVTEAKRAEFERQQATALLRAIIETAPGLIYAKDRGGRMILANAATLGLIGKPWSEVEGRTDLEFLNNLPQAEKVTENDRRIMESGQAEELEERVGIERSQQERVWLSTKTPLRGADDRIIGLVGISVDITERKRSEDRLHLMINELNHRVKNTLVTVQSMVSQTLRGADPVAQSKLEGRLVALASAHDVLTTENWESAVLDQVVAGVLAPHGGLEDSRFQMSGPRLRVLPRAALAVTMGLHELVTNALKYGALSIENGRVEIRWELTADPEPRFRLVWTESGGPAVTPPERRGFGTILIERSLAMDLDGTAHVSFEPAGVMCVIEAPLCEVIAPAEVMPFRRIGGL